VGKRGVACGGKRPKVGQETPESQRFVVLLVVVVAVIIIFIIVVVITVNRLRP